jgi:putative phage-type endonuclease
MELQRTEAWFTARVGVITASCFGDVMAKQDTAAYRNYALQIATERLTGLPAGSDFMNGAMQWGVDTEPLARQSYEAYSGALVEECGLILHPDNPRIGASPDGLVGDGLIECKCPKSATHLEYLIANELPAKYRPQVMGQLYVTGRPWADFVSFDPRFPPYARLLVVRVRRDELYIAKLAEALANFELVVQTLIGKIQPQLREAA